MAQPYYGEIRMFAGNFAPAGWMFCEGQLLPISENDVLFQLIGTTYGGDGQSTFGLPDLRGRIPIHLGNASSGTNYQLGESAGSQEVTLTVNQLPVHSHSSAAAVPAVNTSPLGKLVADTDTTLIYAEGPGSSQPSPNAMAVAGGSQPHDNVMPFLCVNFIISLFGIFPSPN